MQTRRIYFVGLRQGLRVWKTRRFIEQHRRGEDEGFRLQPRLRRTRIPGRAEVLFARNRPERTADPDLAALTRFVDRLDDGTRLVINPPRHFLLADSKDRAFEAWTREGLACPRCWELETNQDDPRDLGCVDQIAALLETEPRIVLRTNNEWESRNLFIVDGDTPRDRIHQVVRSLKEHTAGLRRTRRDTRVVAIEYVDARDPAGFAILGRAFVLLDRVINYHAMVSDKLEFRVADMVPEVFERWVEANRELRRRIDHPDFSSQLVRAVAAVGNNIGAIDFLLRDGVPILLEVNPLWGAVPRRYSFGNADFERLVEQTEDFWSKELPNIAYNLDVVRFYREMYDYIAEYLDRGSHRSDPSGSSVPDVSASAARSRAAR